MATQVLEPTRLDDFEYEAALERLRDYHQQLERADRQADTGSLDRAADLARIFEDRRWAAELPPPKRSRFKPVDPYSRSRFATWIKAKLDYQPAHSYRLLNADDLRRVVSPTGELTPGIGERVLRSLSPLLRKGQAGEIPAIWARAVKLAHGGTPTNAHVKQALADHNKATGYTSPPRAKARKAEQYRKKVLSDWENLLEYGGPEDAKSALAEMVERLKARAGSRD